MSDETREPFSLRAPTEVSPELQQLIDSAASSEPTWRQYAVTVALKGEAQQ